MDSQETMLLFSGSVNHELAEEIAAELGSTLGNVKLEKFANGEIYARYLESVEFLLKNALIYYKGEQANLDLHTMLESVGELLNMILFGVLQQTDVPTVSSPPPNPTWP